MYVYVSDNVFFSLGYNLLATLYLFIPVLLSCITLVLLLLTLYYAWRCCNKRISPLCGLIKVYLILSYLISSHLILSYLISLYTNSCTSSQQSVELLKFVDDTTLIGLISDGDESAYKWQIDQLVSRCRLNNLELNALKTVEMVVDFRKNPASPSPTQPFHPV